MKNEKDSFNKMALLTGAKIFGIFFSIVIPMYLGRKLPVETYGTYKQLMLLFWFAQVGLNFGLDDSVYFYLRRDPKNYPLYSINALFFNLFATFLIWIFIIIYKVEIAKILGNMALVQYIPLLGLLISSTVASMQFGGILIGTNRFRERLYLEIGLEFFKSLSIFVAFVVFNSIFVVLELLSLIMILQVMATIYLLHQHKIKENLNYKDSLKLFPAQLKFGLPLGISRIMQNILNMENFLISSFLGMIQFTYYSVGCFENPLVNATKAALYELVNIEMADGYGDNEKILNAWLRMTRKLFLVIIPFIIYMMFFARELIIFIFSEKYSSSVPFFMIFNIYVFLASLNPEPIFRATSQTKLSLKIKTTGSLIGVVLMVLGAYYSGAKAVLIGKILAMIIINLSGLIVGAKLIGKDFFQMFQWKQLGGIVSVSIFLAGAMRLLFISAHWHSFWILAASFSLYGIFHFLFSCKLKLIKEDEIFYLKTLLNQFILQKKLLNQRTPKIILRAVLIRFNKAFSR